MNGKRIYAIVLISMLLLAAFGAWVIVETGAAYRAMPRIEEQSRHLEFQSRRQPLAEYVPA